MKHIINPVRKVLYLIFVSALMWIFAVHADPASENTNSIQSITASPVEGGGTVLKIGLKNAIDKVPDAFKINVPARIAFDFANTINELGKSSKEFGDGELRSINIIQAGSHTRLIVNLNTMLNYESWIEGKGLVILLQAKDTGSKIVATSTTRFAEAKPGIQTHSLRDVDFRRGKNGEGRVQIDLSDSRIGIDIKQQGRNLIVDFANTVLPKNLQRKLDVVDFGTPVQLVDAYSQGDNTRLIIEPKGAWEYAAYQTDNKFIIEVKPVIADANKTGKLNNLFEGAKLSLNFQNITTREALGVIADFTNLNMVISDTVNGNLTLRLKDVPWDQALQIMLDSRGLVQQKEGNVIMVAPREEVAARQKDALTSQKIISDLEPLQTEAFPLSYAKVADVKNVLSGSQQRTTETETSNSANASATSTKIGGDSIAVDARTNTLYVTATQSRLAQIREIIKKLDIPVRQVLIEARFVQATTSYNAQIGGKLGYTGPAVAAGGGSPVGTTGGYGLVTAGGVNNTGFVSGQGGSVNLSLFNAAATNVLSLELNASEIDGTTKSIASPRVMTGDSTPATIKSGVEIPYTLAGSATTGPSVAFKDATLSLTVTPKITPDNRVTLALVLSQDTVGSLYGGIPSINTKNVSTTVLVENGGTVVIGGIYTQDIADTVSKVPLLGDIPLIGWLFKNDTKAESKNELLVFITPKILKDSLNLN